MTKQTNEDMTTGNIAVYDMTLKSEPDSNHYNKKCFDVDRKEFKNLINRKAVPERIQKYMSNFRDSDIYVNYKSGDSGKTVKIKLKKLLGV